MTRSEDPAVGVVPIDEETVLTDNEEAAGIIETIEKSNTTRLKDLLNRIVDNGRVQTVLTAMREKRIAAASKHIETRMTEALGQWVARIDVGTWFMMRSIHGNNCWNDPEFIDAYLRDNPHVALKLHTRNYVNGWTGEKAETRKAEKLKF